MMLNKKLQSLPASPGVYLMKDSAGHILYVGKSKNLKQRVRSYFQQSNAHSPKVKKLVNHLKDFELILTDTEFEAFMLECRYIKKYKPLYNKKMKNPLAYTYICIHTNEELHRIEITHNPAEEAGRLHFGPYTSRSTVERAVQGLQECLGILCSAPSSRQTACLNHSLGLCNGVCLSKDAIEPYNSSVNRIAALLGASDSGILEEMSSKMQAASASLEFETAIKYRDYLQAIHSLLHKERVIGFAEANPDIAVIEHLAPGIIKLFLIRRNAILYREAYSVTRCDRIGLLPLIKKRILDTFQYQPSPASFEIGKDEIDESQIIYSYLQGKGSACRFLVIPAEWLSDASHALDDGLRSLLQPCGGDDADLPE